MAIHYCVVPRKLPQNRTKVVYCLSLRTFYHVDREMLIDDMVRHTTLTKQEAASALDYLFEAIIRYLAQGFTVSLGPLGYFKYTISSEGSAESEDVTLDKIKRVRLRYVPGRELRQQVRNFKLTKWEDHFY